MSFKTTVNEMIQALNCEISALKKGKGGNNAKLFHGRLTRKVSGLFIYHFHLENFLAVVDDSPAELEVDEKKYNCQVISVQGLEVELSVEKDLGQSIAEAKLQSNAWYLLEVLRKKYEQALDAEKEFAMSKQLFAGISKYIAGADEPDFSFSGNHPNDSQITAINKSFKNSLALIWGPPGTGKTETIAKAVEAHLRAGRRVLLVSHANNAVDEALEKIAGQLKSTEYYLGGQLIRFGVPRKPTLEQDFPLVNIDNVVQMLGAPLIQEKINIQGEREQLEYSMVTLRQAASRKERVDNALSESLAIEKSKAQSVARLNGSRAELNAMCLSKEELEEKLTRAQKTGTLKRLFLGINPQSIQADLDRLKIRIHTKNHVVLEQKSRCGEIETHFEKSNQKYTDLLSEYHTLLQKLNLTPETLQDKTHSVKKQQDLMQSRITEIEKALSDLQKHALSNAGLIATTLTKTYTAQQINELSYDVLIVDESSMAPLPHLFWAAAKAKLAITIVGDFKQLPPICVSDEEPAKRWLGRSIYDILEIKSIDMAAADERVALLDTQYRMHPNISAVSNQLFYGGLLKDDHSTLSLLLSDSFGDSPLNLVNTTQDNPWSSQLSTGGRFNIHSALVCVSLARKLLESAQNTNVTKLSKIGIVTPYRAQARLMSKISEDWNLRNSLYINTVHSFQGGEEAVIIFDCVEGPGSKKWSLLDDINSTPDALFLLNVALTRAKYKVYLVAHKDYISKNFLKDTAIRNIISLFIQNGREIPSSSIIENYVASEFEKWVEVLHTPTPTIDYSTTNLYTEKNFWPAFLSDLQNTQTSVTIMSPFVSLNRAGRLMDTIQVLKKKKVNVQIYTRPPEEHQGTLIEHSRQVVDQLQKIGAKVLLRKGMHQKIAIFDDHIAWEGSLNILSHRDTEEQMRRIIGENAIKEIIRSLRLGEDKEITYSKMPGKPCPQCYAKGQTSELLLKESRYGPFLGCSSFPKTGCRYKEDLPNTKTRRGTYGKRP